MPRSRSSLASRASLDLFSRSLARMYVAVAVATVAVFGLFVQPAFADEENTIAVFVDGQGANDVREALLKALPAGTKVVDSKVFRANLARAGQTKPFSNPEKLDKKEALRLQRALDASSASSILMARVITTKNARVVRMVVDAQTPSRATKRVARLGPKPSSEDPKRLEAALAGTLDRFAPVRPPDPPPAPTPEVPPDPAADDVAPAPRAPPLKPKGPDEPSSQRQTGQGERSHARRVASAWLDVAVGGEAFWRTYEFDNGIARSPYLYKLAAAPGLRLGATFYPLSLRTQPSAPTGLVGAGDFGLQLDYSRLALSTSDFGGGQRTGAPHTQSVAARVRIHPIGKSGEPRAVFGVALGYTYTWFGTVGPEHAELPNVSYRAVRPAVDARVLFGRFSLVGGAGFRVVISPDKISPLRFQHPSGFGLDVELGATFAITAHVEARLTANYTRYAFGTERINGNTIRAGSVTDATFGLRPTLALLF